ncbi:helix-turn-helix domain-containing protein [Candidatus Marsarchaeota archaeon]|nr:helix-turn-helix domain-containing protein [Candidatus Marsarchaeota archaeon]
MGDESECENKRHIRHININGVINMVAMKTAYGYRAYPSKEQKEILNRQMFLSKELHRGGSRRSRNYTGGIVTTNHSHSGSSQSLVGRGCHCFNAYK